MGSIWTNCVKKKNNSQSISNKLQITWNTLPSLHRKGIRSLWNWWQGWRSRPRAELPEKTPENQLLPWSWPGNEDTTFSAVSARVTSHPARAPGTSSAAVTAHTSHGHLLLPNLRGCSVWGQPEPSCKDCGWWSSHLGSLGDGPQLLPPHFLLGNLGTHSKASLQTKSQKL